LADLARGDLKVLLADGRDTSMAQVESGKLVGVGPATNALADIVDAGDAGKSSARP
jgi:hypothetical protein